jgi:sulfoxide reductase heme-binding subunit YedZ
MHLTTSPADWYAARAAGLAAYLLLSTVVCLGLTMAGKKRLERWPRFALEDVHRFGGLLVGTFIVIHVFTIAIDAYLPFSVASIVVPFVSTYRPIFVALGIVAAELLLALAVTNHYRDRLPYRFWRRAHYVNFAVWTGATVHALGSGTDRSTPWLMAVIAAGVVAVTAGVVLRFLRPWGVVPVAALGATVVVLLATGPLRFHPRPWNARTFHGTLTGQVLRDVGTTRALVSAAATAGGRQRALLRADLLLEPNHLAATSFRLEFLPSGMLCVGRVTKVERFGFDATCRAEDGTRRFVRASWGLSQSNTFTGEVHVHA